MSELRSKDSQLDANLSKAVNDANAAAHGLGNRIDEANSAASALDMKVERQRLEIEQMISQHRARVEAALRARHHRHDHGQEVQ